MIDILTRILRLAVAVVVITGALCHVVFAQRSDPYGCRLKIRSELGLRPYEGPSHPDFWNKVDSCIARAQSGAQRNVEREKSAATAKQRQVEAKDRKEAAAKTKPSGADNKPASMPVAAVTEKPATDRPVTDAAKAPLAVDFGRRVALVIGNTQYAHVPVLPNAVSDAQALAKSLEATGFQSVTLKMNLTREQLVLALSDFAKQADGADWAAVYYSGHGIEYRGINYMIPVDAWLKVDRDIDLETVDVGKVSSAIEGASKLRLIMLDACRDNPFLEQMKRTVATRSVSRGLARIEPDAGTLIVYAAKHGETALDGEGKNSPFATALIRRMQMPRIELRRLFDLVRDDVLAATNRRQQPFSYGSLSGSEDFYFVR
jgi:hypothetical protein